MNEERTLTASEDSDMEHSVIHSAADKQVPLRIDILVASGSIW